MNIRKKKEIICINCGRKGHIYKKCHLPIVSFGIICINFDLLSISHLLNISKQLDSGIKSTRDILRLKEKINGITKEDLRKKIKFLMIRRRNSFSYIEFIRGKYKLNDVDYILNNLRLMTNDEKDYILNRSFEENWNYVWNIYKNNDNKKYNNEYEDSKEKFEKIKKGYSVNIYNNKIVIKLSDLIDNINNNYDETEWGFPKGRKEQDESEKDCACREFQEETDYTNFDYELLKMNPLNELFMGSNKVKYKHKYFVGQFIGNKEAKINSENKIQKMEISDLRWFNIDECLDKIRDYNMEKKNIISNLYFIIENYILTLKDKINEICVDETSMNASPFNQCLP
jgi:8-oxo-dGTP pyrophosphatase MutT (NUDIX family)